MAVADADFDVGIALSFQPLYCALRELVDDFGAVHPAGRATDFHFLCRVAILIDVARQIQSSSLSDSRRCTYETEVQCNSDVFGRDRRKTGASLSNERCVLMNPAQMRFAPDEVI
jgi:hypothetical protein